MIEPLLAHRDIENVSHPPEILGRHSIIVEDLGEVGPVVLLVLQYFLGDDLLRGRLDCALPVLNGCRTHPLDGAEKAVGEHTGEGSVDRVLEASLENAVIVVTSEPVEHGTLDLGVLLEDVGEAPLVRAEGSEVDHGSLDGVLERLAPSPRPALRPVRLAVPGERLDAETRRRPETLDGPEAARENRAGGTESHDRREPSEGCGDGSGYEGGSDSVLSHAPDKASGEGFGLVEEVEVDLVFTLHEPAARPRVDVVGEPEG